MRRLTALFLLLFLSNSYLLAQQLKTDLPNTNPQSAGFSLAFFPDLSQRMNRQIPSLGSFIVWKQETIVYEGYFHGATPTTSFDIKSITKSVMSALAGVLTGKGMLPDLNTPVLHFFPEFAKPHSSLKTVWFASEKAHEDSIRAHLRLRDLLTMQPGWAWDDFGPIVNTFVNSADPVRFTMDLPFSDQPGTQFNYCSAATSVFSAVLAKCVQADLKAFTQTALFDPANITLTRWDTDPTGRYVGASEMYMTARDLLRFGLLYLHNGKVNDQQLIPATWIRESTRQQAVLNFWAVLPGANGYGYYWWRRKTNGHQAYIASGAGGQLIAVIPDLDMVMVATCFLNAKNRGREEIKRLHLFMDEVTKRKSEPPVPTRVRVKPQTF